MADVVQIPTFLLLALGAAVSVIGATLCGVIALLWRELQGARRTAKAEAIRDAVALDRAARQLEAQAGVPSVYPPFSEEDAEEPTRNIMARKLRAQQRIEACAPSPPRVPPEVADELARYNSDMASTPPGGFDPVPPRKRMPSRPR